MASYIVVSPKTGPKIMEEKIKSQLERKKRQTKKQYNLRNLIYMKKWDKCIEAIKSVPEQAQLVDRMGDFPLHEACNQGAPFQVVQGLVYAYPISIQTKGFCGRLPIHYAAYNKPSLHVIKFLLKQYPDAASVFDADGRLPLHLAVIRNAPKQAIQALIEAYPKSLTIANKFGNTPDMLARNYLIYELLVHEREKPRNVQKKLDIEKKIIAIWNHGIDKSKSSSFEGSLSPVTVSFDGPKSDSFPPLRQRINNAENVGEVAKSTLEAVDPGTNHNMMKSNASRQRSTRPSKQPTPHKDVHPAIRGVHRPSKRNGRNAQKPRKSNHSLRASREDILSLFKASESESYKTSRNHSPRSTLDAFNDNNNKNNHSNAGRGRSIKKNEIMSTSNRRKAIPSPARNAMRHTGAKSIPSPRKIVVQPVWK